MRFEGKVVLDSHDDPVKDWPQLPLTLSSKTRGYRLEIMARENPHIEYRDCKRAAISGNIHMLTSNSLSSYAERHWKNEEV